MRRGEPEGHPDPDLASLCLDDPAREVERPEGGPGEDQDSEDVELLWSPLDVLVQDAVSGVLGQYRHLAA